MRWSQRISERGSESLQVMGQQSQGKYRLDMEIDIQGRNVKEKAN